MDIVSFLGGVAATLIVESLFLIHATERMRKEVQDENAPM